MTPAKQGDQVLRRFHDLAGALGKSTYRDDGNNTIALTIIGRPTARQAVKAISAFVRMLEAIENNIAKERGVHERTRWIASTELIDGGGVCFRLSDGCAVTTPTRKEGEKNP